MALPSSSFTGTVDDLLRVSLYGTDSVGLRRVLSRYKGYDLIVTLEEAQYKRSPQQNRYYWGVIVKSVQGFLLETQGEKITKDEIHAFHLTTIAGYKPITKEVTIFDFEQQKFVKQEVMILGGKSSRNMTVGEFTEFVEKIKEFWHMRDCHIPDPSGYNTLSDYAYDY